MAYQTFKPTVLQDSTQSFSNLHYGQRSTIKMPRQHNDSIAIDELRQVIEGQNQFIHALRDSLESKITYEELSDLLDQLQDLSRDSKIDLFALIATLHQELRQSNSGEQISMYIKEITELKIENQQLEQLQQSRQSKYLAQLEQREEQIANLENSVMQAKLELKCTQQYREQLVSEKCELSQTIVELQQKEKKAARMNSNSLKTEESEKEELFREKEHLKQQIFNVTQEVQKIEMAFELKQQEVEFCQNKITKLDKQIKTAHQENEDLQKQVGAQKYQLEYLKEQIVQLEHSNNKLKEQLNSGQQIYAESNFQLNQHSNLINDVLNQLQEITQSPNQNILEQIDMINEILQDWSLIERQFKLSDEDKSQIIFDLQHKFADAQSNNQKIVEQLEVQEKQIQKLSSEIKQQDKTKKVFRSEYSHIKQMYDQKLHELTQLNERYRLLEDKYKAQVSRTIQIEGEHQQYQEQVQQLQTQLQSVSSINTIEPNHKKSISITNNVDTKQMRLEYYALLQTFEKIRPLFTLETVDLVQDMLNLQKCISKAEADNKDSDLKQYLQDELKLQRQISEYQNIHQKQQYQLNTLTLENKRLKLQIQIRPQSDTQSFQMESMTMPSQQRNLHKQSLSVHLRPKLY